MEAIAVLSVVTVDVEAFHRLRDNVYQVWTFFQNWFGQVGDWAPVCHWPLLLGVFGWKPTMEVVPVPSALSRASLACSFAGAPRFWRLSCVRPCLAGPRVSLQDMFYAGYRGRGGVEGL